MDHLVPSDQNWDEVKLSWNTEEKKGCVEGAEVTLLDYGAGNVRSIRNAIHLLGYKINEVGFLCYAKFNHERVLQIYRSCVIWWKCRFGFSDFHAVEPECVRPRWNNIVAQVLLNNNNLLSFSWASKIAQFPCTPMLLVKCSGLIFQIIVYHQSVRRCDVCMNPCSLIMMLWTLVWNMQVNRPEDINNAKRLIFPGVGSFKSAMEVLNAKGYILTSISWACDFIGFANWCGHFYPGIGLWLVVKSCRGSGNALQIWKRQISWDITSDVVITSQVAFLQFGHQDGGAFVLIYQTRSTVSRHLPRIAASV